MEKRTLTKRGPFYIFITRLPLFLIVGWAVFLFPFYLTNMGGYGLKLPVNIIACIVIAMSVVLIWITRIKNTIKKVDINTHVIILGAVILGIPLLYTSSDWIEAGISRWGGLLGGVFFYFSLLQYDFSHKKRCLIITGILIAVVFQSVIAIIQLWYPEHVPAWFAYPRLLTRPYGVFQQVNVLATFVATGLTLVLMMFIFYGLISTRSCQRNLNIFVLGSLLLMFTSLLVWLQSRVGWISGGVSSLMMMLIGLKKAAKKRVLWAVFLQALAIVLAVLIQAGGHVDFVEHTASNNARFIILSDTLKMIASKPWLGWGYGGFEHSFQHFRASQHLSTLGLGVVRHPHNEILLWWAEGGMVALAGLLVLLYAALRIIRLAWQALDAPVHQDKYRASLPLLLIVALVPMLIHTQTEYPFLLSTPLWLIFILLLAMSQSQLNESISSTTLSPRPAFVLSIVSIVISAVAVLYFTSALYANLKLTQFERSGFTDISVAQHAMKYDLGSNTERWLYDKNLYDLMSYQKNKEIASLQQYREWAGIYLAKRIDRNVYGNLCGVLLLLKDEDSYLRIRKRGISFFPDDARFNIDATND